MHLALILTGIFITGIVIALTLGTINGTLL